MNAAPFAACAADLDHAVPAPRELSPDLYAELRRIAWRHLGADGRNHTLQPTALVHEAYLKLARLHDRGFYGDSHFLAVASRAMRQILVDYARAKTAYKRSGACAGVPVDDLLAAPAAPGPLELLQVIELDNALQALSEQNPRVARVLEMCYFAGMTAEETADALGVSVHTARHDVRFGQAWLRRKLGQSSQTGDNDERRQSPSVV